MAIFVRKRARRVRLANRLGSRRTKLLLAISFSLIAAASYLLSTDASASESNYYVAMGDLAKDSALDDQSVRLISLDLKDQANRYLQSDSKVSDWVLAKPVRAGELIPLSALTNSSESECVALRVSLGVELSKSIHRGDVIDLWAGASSNSVESAPVQIVSAGLLLEIDSATDSLGQNQQDIEICVSPAEIRSVVYSVSSQDVIVGVLTL